MIQWRVRSFRSRAGHALLILASLALTGMLQCRREQATRAFSPASSVSDYGCDIEAVLRKADNRCTNAGCHGPGYSGGLDLVSPGIEARLVGKPAQNPACNGDALIDPLHPEASVLLRRIDGERHRRGESCGPIMPMGSSGVSPQDLACFRAWVGAAARAAPNGAPKSAPFEAANLDSALGKVKSLLHGGAVTREERALAATDPQALGRLIDTWMSTPEFAHKMKDFLSVALQQKLARAPNNQFFKLRAHRKLKNAFHSNLEESFVRTAWDIIARGRPFNEIATTRRWAATTAVAVALRYLDNGEEVIKTETPGRALRNHRIVAPAAAGASGPKTLAESIRDRVWLLPDVPNARGCNRRADARNVLEFFLGFGGRCPEGRVRFQDAVLGPSDFEDWRFIELRPATTASPVPFYDVIALRKARRLDVTLPRVGFFTTPAFLGNWATNADNQFRVTVNQSLIAGLGLEFTGGDATPPVSHVGLDGAHAEPNTPCYGCHSLLDPMRAYFGNAFSSSYVRAASPMGWPPSFAFYQSRLDGGELSDFAARIATHPAFATGWAQKLCYFANSQPCALNDPEFQRVATAFTQSGYDFKVLVRTLLSSPLVTGLHEVETHERHEFLISIRRQRHLCQSLSARLGVPEVCDLARGLVGLIPEDEFARGAATPVQAAVTSSFHSAAGEQLCGRLGRRLIGARKRHAFRPSNAEAALNAFTEQLMGLERGHPRHAEARRRLGRHYAAALELGANRAQALRSAFTLACVSPDVMALGL